MTEYRYTLIGIRSDGGIADLARFKTRDLAELLLQNIGDKYKGFSFEIDDIYREKNLSEVLTDDDSFD